MDASDVVTPSEDPLAGVPELSSYLATDDFEKMEALKLVADSIAQQRQAANSALVAHPLNLSVAVLLLGVAGQYMRNHGYDAILILLSMVGVIMCGLAACRFATQGYLNAAEEINWEWVGDSDIFVTKFGDEVIGTVIIEWVSGESRTKKRKAWRGLIRAWTVRLKYRNKGVGGALLEDAVKETKKKSAESLEFADDHANSRRVLPRLYNGVFDKRELKVRDGLRDLMETSPGRKRK